MGRIILNNEEYTGSSGGSGNVDDVEVNGVSVLDPSDKIAKITSYKEITRAEYEALPDTKLNDNIAYFITDGSSAKVQGYPPLIYSKYEREIGCWLNGKPLYRKTFSISAQSNTISTSLLNNLDIQFVTNLYLIVWQSNNFYVDFVNIKWNSNTKSLILPSTSVFVLALVVEYTKTTDTAGSGTWNGQGGIAHHYSTNETVVGTWIDGKPLYEITYEANSGRGTYDDFLPSDFEDVITHSAFIKSFNNTIWSSPYYATASDWWGYYFENRKLIVRGSNSLPINTLRVIVQYTKTTD